MKKHIETVIVIGAFIIILAGCAVPVITQTPTGPVTNYVANATATTIASGAQVAAPLVPQPYGVIIGALGLLLAAGAGGVAAYKNAQANQHLSTLQSVISGVENSLPGVSAAITTVLPAAASNPTATNALTIANNAISAVKASITSATVANGTNANLNTIAATVGAGPSAA